MQKERWSKRLGGKLAPEAEQRPGESQSSDGTV
jgi:hypothetical protein